MKQTNTNKLFSVLLAFCFFISIFANYGKIALATTLTPEEEKYVLSQKLKQVEQRIQSLKGKSENTQQYIDALNQELGYLKQQYSISQSEFLRLQNQVDSITSSISQNQQSIALAQKSQQQLQYECSQLEGELESICVQYSQRLRALYVSQNHAGYLTFLLNSGDVASFLLRLQMTESVAQQDSALAKGVESKLATLASTKNQLQHQIQQFTDSQQQLLQNQSLLKQKRAELLSKQDGLATELNQIESKQSIANESLLALHQKTQSYGEYRDITKAQLDQIDKDIAAADKEYSDSTTANTTPTTSKSVSTTQASTQKATSTTNTQNQSKYISLICPCPSYPKITCAFGEYAGHTGCDFSTKGEENQKIVAAADGVVILVKNLNHSYGHYVVIRHTTTTKQGDTVYTLYAHNNDIIVKQGQRVKQGQQIAYSGSTGNSTGPHCHFEVRVGGSSQAYAQNPTKYLKDYN